MFLCYVEEAGDTGALPTATSPIQPVLCLLALTLEESRLVPFTLDFLDVKAKYFPGRCRCRTRIERILVEIKGKDIRAAFRSTSTNHDHRHTCTGFLDALFDLIERYQCRVFGRVWIKPLAEPINGPAVFTSSAQAICATFHQLLEARGQQGLVIPDPRAKHQDQRVSFSIFTQKFKVHGDAYPRLIEMPVFGQSVNHAGIQVCDLLCSGVLYPIAAYTYCSGHVNNIHVDPGFALLKNRYGAQLRDRFLYEYYSSADARWHGGIVVSDPLGQKHSGHLYG